MIHEFPYQSINVDALRLALIDALGTGINSVQASTDDWIRIDVDGITRDQIEPILAEHDPVFLTPSARSMVAGSDDPIRIDIDAPKAGAAPVALLIDSFYQDPDPVIIDLIDGAGTLNLYIEDVMCVWVYVQNGDNRNKEHLEFRGV